MHFWPHLVLLFSLEQEGGAAALRGQMLSSKSDILWIDDAFKTTGNSEKKYVESWWRHWSSGRSSRKRPDLQFRVGWPFKTYFHSLSSFIPDFPVVLNSLKSGFRSSELTVVLTAWPMLNVYHFKIGKELNPRFGTTHPLSLISSKPLMVELAISNLSNVYVQWPMSTDTLYL